MPGDPIHPLQLASVLLQYPAPETSAAVAALDPGEIEPLSGGQRRALESFLGWYRQEGIEGLRSAYVQTFDFDRKSSLHLTYHQHGDSRQRGLALLQIKSAYREAGLDPGEGELPDYLPLMLEFAAIAPAPLGRELLERHRPAIELIGGALQEAGSPWSGVLDLIRAELPRLSSRQLARIRRLAEQGPPSEQVGLEPFAPPEVMPAAAGEVPLPLVGGMAGGPGGGSRDGSGRPA